jgi:hypothetical protein
MSMSNYKNLFFVFYFKKSHMSKLKMSLTKFKLKNDKAILKKSKKFIDKLKSG